MTSNACRLEKRRTADGSFSLFSQEFGEGFHSGQGALQEAERKFVQPAGLDRLAPGATMRVLDVCVGTGSNSAALIEHCIGKGVQLSWWGLELDPEPLRLALGDHGYRRQWTSGTLQQLELLCSGERMLWGDARERLPQLIDHCSGTLDLVMMDAFSPSRCPQLWTVEFLTGLGKLLSPQGRLLTYCSAAAVRNALRLAGLHLATIEGPSGLSKAHRDWSGGTAASRTAIEDEPLLRPLSEMEQQHLKTSAAEPYRDPSGRADRATILRQRQVAQAAALQGGAVESTGAWRRRWGMPPSGHQ